MSDHNAKNDEDSSSASSTPVHDSVYEPFQPRFVVKVTEPVKNGDIVNYTVKTTKVSDGSDCSVSRQYEDFEFLHHCLISQNNTDGIIVRSKSDDLRIILTLYQQLSISILSHSQSKCLV